MKNMDQHIDRSISNIGDSQNNHTVNETVLIYVTHQDHGGTPSTKVQTR